MISIHERIFCEIFLTSFEFLSRLNQKPCLSYFKHTSKREIDKYPDQPNQCFLKYVFSLDTEKKKKLWYLTTHIFVTATYKYATLNYERRKDSFWKEMRIFVIKTSNFFCVQKDRKNCCFSLVKIFKEASGLITEKTNKLRFYYHIIIQHYYCIRKSWSLQIN